MQFWYFPELCIPICITSVDFVLVIRFSLFTVVCIVESVGRIHEDIFDVITNIYGILLKVSLLQLIAHVQELFIQASLLSMTTLLQPYVKQQMLWWIIFMFNLAISDIAQCSILRKGLFLTDVDWAIDLLVSLTPRSRKDCSSEKNCILCDID
jgi:hypothetical protein